MRRMADGAAGLKGGVNVTKHVPLDCHIVVYTDTSFVYLHVSFFDLCPFSVDVTLTTNVLVLVRL